MVVFGFMLVILWILVFLMIVGNVAMGTVCGIIRDINQGDKTILDNF